MTTLEEPIAIPEPTESERGEGATEAAAPRPSFVDEVRRIGADVGRWPAATKVFAVAVILLFAPVMWEAGQAWMKDEQNAHGVFILPIVAFLLWVLRDDIRGARSRPSGWGLPLLVFGLLLETASYLLRIKFVPVVSLVPVLAGGILMLHGRALWKVVCFPVCFLAFAAPIPDMIVLPVTSHVQRSSTDLSVQSLRFVGYSIIQTGNIIEIPGMSLEVADVCSGFKKLTALVAFSFVYGFMFPIGFWKRALLVASAYPIALAANVIRICGLVMVSSMGGKHALEIAHNSAEMFVLVVAFVLFVGLGRLLGCRTLKHSI